jgi:hypothetical protein
MKLKGKKVEGLHKEVIVLPRNKEDIILWAQAVLDYEPFFKLCPMPEPKVRNYPDGRKVADVEDPNFKKALHEWAGHKTTFMILKSLEATPELEWETVNLSDFSTWNNWKSELRTAGIAPNEIEYIVEQVAKANALSEEHLEAAKQRFLSRLAQEISQ